MNQHKSSTKRVRRSREKRAHCGYRRVEFTIRDGHIDKLRKLACELQIPVGAALEKAIDLLERV